MEIDWQALGKVSAVKDQGVCDAGYAFCSAALIESFYLFDNRNVSLSEQQIIDCSANYTTFGCGGGSRIGTINYIREKGLTDSIQYPYRGVKNNCQRPDGGENKPAYTHLEHQGCAALQTGLYTSPLTVAVNAKDWQSYKSGIFDGCTSTEVNHDTYLIGVTAGFWRIKNSWGLKWGEYGFIRLKAGNTCGICEKPGFGFKK
jgi:C1A family cysteine protease